MNMIWAFLIMAVEWDHPETVLSAAQAAGSGDRAAQQELLDHLYPRIRTTVYYLAGSHPDRDDMVQRSLIEVLHSVSGFKGLSKLETWADRIVVRTTMRYLRQHRKHADIVQVKSDPHDGHEGTVGVDNRRQVRESLLLLLEKIPHERRESLLLHFGLGYSVQEISEMTATKINTVRDRLRVGRAELRRFVSEDVTCTALLKGETS